MSKHDNIWEYRDLRAPAPEKMTDREYFFSFKKLANNKFEIIGRIKVAPETEENKQYRENFFLLDMKKEKAFKIFNMQ